MSFLKVLPTFLCWTLLNNFVT